MLSKQLTPQLAHAEHPIPAPSTIHRFPELDSLRGLAASIVVLHHYLGLCSWPVQSWANALPTNILFAGDSAVLLFFTLSGFVLTLPYKRPAQPAYGLYLLKRACRIYLPYLAAIFLALAIYALVPSPVFTGHPWLDATWNSRISAHQLLLHLTGIANFDTRILYGPFWTLVIEMRVSLLMPFLSRLALRLQLLPGLFASCIACIVLHYLDSKLPTTSPLHALTLTSIYTCLFLNGALLAVHFDTVTAAFRKLSSTTRITLLAAGLLTFGYIESIPANILSANSLLQHSAGLRQCLASLASMLAIIAASQLPRLRHFLHRPAILRCGAISYSLYLTHLIVLLTWVHLFWNSSTFIGRHFLLTLLPVYLIGSWLLAELFHRLIELPSTHLGRWVDRRHRVSSSSATQQTANGPLHTSPAHRAG
jgi:peptidoglycan/LPS O-acetylase OafA/YrhL